MNPRSVREMRLIGECLDDLLAGNLNKCGDKLMQRLKAIQRSHIDGNWNTAKHLEVGGDEDVSLISQRELRDAVTGQVVETRLASDAAKASSRAGSGQG
eukprot:12405164-Karenia_brevis.AAC.1